MESIATDSQFRQIGKGFCGSVWAADRAGPASAMKREDGGPQRSVTKDSEMHKRIESSLSTLQRIQHLATHLDVPEHRQFVTASDKTWWSAHAGNFPSGYEHCNTLITERILPLDRPVRDRLIDLFCLERARDTIKSSRKDEDCLVRPYLGRRRNHFSCPSQYFTLRNKPLLVNQMEDLGLPVETYARIMADALAVMYWHAQTDANDVEFVLAPPRKDEDGLSSDVLDTHRMWTLDFDCVNPITLDAQGVERAAVAFYKNDPFFPRPDSEDERDQRLWELFVERFIQSSVLILGSEELPRMLVERLTQLGRKRGEKKQELQSNETMQER
ncbi:calcineurin-like phosphoesterase [Teratosphaeria destructans]|uniref:Calcineurin-like phosphoesterase n=1 Tax=Teratosphaeria destructans TaxID=418781 RepID=A0A9W7SXH2_9PEZI|nr:calcineurin-like phosphoesterase [Teratosphaeria destructans]